MGNCSMKTGDDVLTPAICTFDENEVTILKKSWAILSVKLYDNGERVLYSYFDKYPQNQLKFESFRHTPLLMLKGTPGFRSHASKIMNVISTVIDSIDKDPKFFELRKIIAEVGKSHSKKRIKKTSFIQFQEVFLLYLADSCHLEVEGLKTWNKVFDSIFYVFFECFDGNVAQFY